MEVLVDTEATVEMAVTLEGVEILEMEEELS
jgi:hypothetical protein